MIMLNVGSKYITIELTITRQYLRNTCETNVNFYISWMGSRDIITALGLTAVFNVLIQHLLMRKVVIVLFQKMEKLLMLLTLMVMVKLHKMS